jgi:cysteine-rich repeat protein
MVKHSLILSSLLIAACSRDFADSPQIGKTQQAVSQVLQSEGGDNDVSATATPLLVDGNGVALVRANLLPLGDVDLFSFSATAGDKIYAATMTAWSADGAIPDSVLDLLGTDGTSLIESDDDEGSFSNYASSIAGAIIPANGTYYLKVRPFSAGGNTLRPYDLHFQRRTGSPVAETEDNGPTAQNLPASHWVSGALSSGSDTDNFLFSANAGDTVFLSLDLDPEVPRNGGDWNARLSLSPFGTGQFAISANNTGLRSAPHSEALFVTVQETGDYWASVASGDGASTGTYALSVTIDPKAGDPVGVSCSTYTSTDIPITITSGPSTVSSDITVPSGAGRVGSLEVALNIDHNRMEDLNVSLTAPGGNTVGLFNAVGSPTAGVQTTMNLVLDDTAATPIDYLDNTVARMRAQPTAAHRLEWFNGQSVTGTWTLNVNDTLANNSGTIQGWSIRVCTMTTPVASCPGGTTRTTVLSEDFEDDNGGFTHSGTLDEWERGTPSVAPINSCASGTNCWKTDLDGTYNPSSNATLVSPAIDLSNTAGSLIVSWMQKSNIESALRDSASVTIREEDDSNSTPLWTWLGGNGATGDHEAAGWGLHQAVVPGYAGDSAELVFNLTADSSIQWTGLAVDDVVISACVYVCGDGDELGAEECDDGNTDSGDGCDENCRLEEPNDPDAGTDSGAPSDGGETPVAPDASTGGSGGAPSNDDAGNAGGGGGEAGNTAAGGTMERPPIDFPDSAGSGGTAGSGAATQTDEDSGCGCKLAGRSSSRPWSALAFAMLLGTAAVRRRKRT